MKPLLSLLALAFAAVPTTLVYAAAIGLGLHRHAHPLAVSLSATLIVFAPGMMAGVVARRHRVAHFAVGTGLWALLGLLAIPVYFPGERRDAVATGLALLSLTESWEGMARSVAEQLPDEPGVSEPELPQAALISEERPRGSAPKLEDHQIALPYEGEGRNLTIPVVFESGGTQIEVQMMLDTGATYTTLSNETLNALGIFPGPSDPSITLRTANGAREASVVFVDRVWLGDLAIEGVAIATCEECESGDAAGLLGLNVAGGFNVNIDADFREVTFTQRDTHNRRLDVKHAIDLRASFSRYRGGRVEVHVTAENTGTRPVEQLVAAVGCRDQRFKIPLGSIAAGETADVKQRLPPHGRCEGYEILLHEAQW